MQADTVGTFVWVGLIICYAWSVWSLARLRRRPLTRDARPGGVEIVVETTQRPCRRPEKYLRRPGLRNARLTLQAASRTAASNGVNAIRH